MPSRMHEGMVYYFASNLIHLFSAPLSKTGGRMAHNMEWSPRFKLKPSVGDAIIPDASFLLDLGGSLHLVAGLDVCSTQSAPNVTAKVSPSALCIRGFGITKGPRSGLER